MSYVDSASGVTVRLWSTGLGGDAEGDTYDSIERVIGSSQNDIISGLDHVGEELHGGAGDDELYGFGGDDRLFGGEGSDYLNGGNGDDHLDGGEGDDWLSGGSGNDTFHFNLNFGRDTISDFKHSGADKIAFSSAVFASAGAVLAASQQVGGDVHIAHSDDDHIVLLNTQLSSLSSSDVMIV